MSALTLDALRSWLDDYGQAWATHDATAVDRLYRGDVVYYETPFDEPMIGIEAVREYSRGHDTTQKDVRFAYDAIAVDGDRGLAQWWATFERVPSGTKVELDGFAAIRLDADKRCYEFREWWHRRET